MTESTDELKGIGVADMRAAVQSSGELAGVDGPDFMAEAGAEWLPYFSAAEYGEGAHPEFARVIVTRNGQAPRRFVISWAEYEAEIEDEREQAWAAGRRLKPMSIFGAEVERHAYRVVFADILEPLVQARRAERGGRPEPTPRQTDGDPWEPARDWHADLAKAVTPQDLDALFDEARAAKALTDPAVHEAFGAKLREITAKATRAIVADTVAEAAEAVPATRIPTVPSPAVVAAKVKPLTVDPVKPRPQGQRRKRPPRDR